MSQTSFIRVERKNGVWWLINAQGEQFVSIGVNHVQASCWLAPYNHEVTLKKYGRDFVDEHGRFNPRGKAVERWVANVLRIMKDWGFNTLGMHTHGPPHPLYKDQVYYVASTYTARLAAYQFRFGQDRFPDIFSEEFRNNVRRRVRRVCETHKNEPNLLGYAYTDIPAWVVPRRYLKEHPEWEIIHPWVDDLRRLPANAAGKQQWLKVLQNHYSSPAEVAQVYSLNANTWDDLAAVTEWPSPMDTKRAVRDNVALLQAMAEHWYSLHFTLIRQHDPHHLILGDKLGDFPDWLLAIVKKYVDVVFIQRYTPFEIQKPLLLRLYKAIGKPLINGDSSFGVVKPPHQTNVKGYRVKSLKEMGEHYYAYLKGIMSLPFMLGWHHCGFMEQWDGAKPPGSTTQNENGFMDPFERPYKGVVEKVIEANRKAMEWHDHAPCG